VSTGLHQEFDPTVIPSYLKRDVRQTIEVAMALGWVMHISSAQSVTIISPDEKKRYHFSSSGRTSTPMNRVRRDIVKYADPAKLQAAYEAKDLFTKQNRDLAGLAMSLLPAPGEPGTVVDHRPDLEAEAKRKAQEKDEANRRRIAARREAEAAQRTLEAQDSKPQPKPEAGATQTTQTEASGSESEPTIVKQEPMMAKASQGRAYPSKVAIERHWSDGSIDYKCVDCDYTTPNRLSIRAHRGNSGHTARGADRSDTRLAEVPLAATYKPRQTRVEALAEALKALLEQGGDPEEIARKALMWVHEQTQNNTRHAVEHEPLTAEDTLARIRMLLDDGTQAQAILERDQRIETLVEESQKLKDRVEELESFIELAQSLRRRDDE
jgi:hypothetical protein